MPSAAGALDALAPTIPSAAKQAATILMCFIWIYFTFFPPKGPVCGFRVGPGSSTFPGQSRG
jgi:hypothetical protein